MHRAMFHRLIAVALVLFCAFPALGQFTRDKAANKKIDEAINTHYFATDFDKAEGVLLGTVEACGDKCSPQTLGRAWMYIGIVRGSGKKDMAGAKEAFATAISLDANVKLDTDLASAETKAAFAESGGSGGGATVAPPADGGEDIGGEAVPDGDVGGAVPGGMVCTPDVTEMQTRRPVPVSCSSEAGPASVELRYKAFGEKAWKKVPLKNDGDYWQAEIPCEATADAGALRWYVQARGETGDVVDNFGTEQQPVVMSVTEDSAAEPPAFPGQVAPERCGGIGSDAEICPPDFPGCGGQKDCGDKDWGASCDNSSECKCGLLCIDGACETAPSCESDSDCPVGSCVGGTCSASGDGGGAALGPYKGLWIGAHFGYDLGTVGGDDVCYSKTQENGVFACFEGSNPYPNNGRGLNAPNASGRDQFYSEEPHTGTNIASGIAPGTMRALLSLDYALTPRLTLGGRAGYAFGGNPGDFLPVHAEARGSYHFLGLNSMFGPYAGLSAGLAQVDMKVSATMFNCSPRTQAQDPTYGMPQLDGYTGSPDEPPNGYTDGTGDYANIPSGRAYQDCVQSGLGEQKEQLPKVPVDVYQKSGPVFVGGHLGGILRFGSEPKNMGVQLNVNVMVMLPKSSVVLEPSLGFVYGM